MKDKLPNLLFSSGTKFITTDKIKDGTYPPGSTGFISYVAQGDENYQDIAKISAIITRRGKTGKDRLERASIYVPVFFFDHPNFMKLLPEGRKAHLHIEPDTTFDKINLIACPTIDFIGWASAITGRLRYMAENCQHSLWPEGPENPLNIIRRAMEHFEGDAAEEFVQRFNNIEMRKRTIQELRMKVSGMARVELEFSLRELDVLDNSARFLLFTNRGEFIEPNEEDKTNQYLFLEGNDVILEKNINFYSSCLERVKSLYTTRKSMSTNYKEI